MPPKTFDYVEAAFRKWWVNATPLERVKLENNLLDYRIKEEELKRLDALPPENPSRYVYKVEAIFKDWHEEKKRDAENRRKAQEKKGRK